MTTIFALGWAELGSIISLLVLWIALSSLLFTIIRGRRGDRQPPRGL